MGAQYITMHGALFKIQCNKTGTPVGRSRHPSSPPDILLYFYLPLLFPNSTGTEQSSMCTVCSIPSACAVCFLQWFNDAWIWKEHIICMHLFLKKKKKKKCTIMPLNKQISFVVCWKILWTGESKYGSISGGLEGCPTGVPITLHILHKKRARCIVIYFGTLPALAILLRVEYNLQYIYIDK